jgi:methylthioribose-1-phosphate isomerase
LEEIRPIEWVDGGVRLLDQTRLPHEEVYLTLSDHHQVAAAISELRVRGAPLIGIAAAYGLALAGQNAAAADREGFLAELRAAADLLEATRPTAVNLSWALRRLLSAAAAAPDIVDAPRQALVTEALRIHREDAAAQEQLSRHGAQLLSTGGAVLTICNTGALATGGVGTALGVIRAAWDEVRLSRVFVCETRPLLQGARLTAWELQRLNIPHTLIVDSAAGLLLRRGGVDCVIVGADRIAANGDVANKVGTYPLAVLARQHDVPFYVAAPTNTVDLATPSGDDIPIEERPAEEVISIAGVDTAPEGTAVLNPAFDVTPHQYVTAIITERGVLRRPYSRSLSALSGAAVR